MGGLLILSVIPKNMVRELLLSDHLLSLKEGREDAKHVLFLYCVRRQKRCGISWGCTRRLKKLVLLILRERQSLNYYSSCEIKNIYNGFSECM